MPRDALRPRSVRKMVELGAAEGDLQDYWDRFTAHLKYLGRSPLTIKNYLSDLKAFGQWLKESGRGFSDLTTVDWQEIEQYQEFLLEQQKLKPNSVNRRLGTLKTFYIWLHQADERTSEPLPRMTVPAEPISPERVAPLSQDEQLRLLAAVEQSQNYRDRAIIQLLLATGLRVGELCELRWADLDLGRESGHLLVQSVKSWQVRKLGLPPDVCATLRDLSDQAQAGSQATVFVGQRGDMTARGVQDVVKKYALRAGLRNLTPRMMRHTCARRLIEQDVPLPQIAAWMGVSAGMLLSSYASETDEGRLMPRLPVGEAPP